MLAVTLLNGSHLVPSGYPEEEGFSTPLDSQTQWVNLLEQRGDMTPSPEVVYTLPSPQTRPPLDAQTIQLPPALTVHMQQLLARSWLRWMQQLYKEERQRLDEQAQVASSQTPFAMLKQYMTKRHSITIEEDTPIQSVYATLYSATDSSPISQRFQREWLAYRRCIASRCDRYRDEIDSLHPGSFMSFLTQYTTFGNALNAVHNPWWRMAKCNSIRSSFQTFDMFEERNLMSDSLAHERYELIRLRIAKQSYWTRGMFQQDLANAVFSFVMENWSAVPHLVRVEWKEELSMSLTELHRASQSAANQVTHDTQLYVTQPDIHNKNFRRTIVHDLKTWKAIIEKPENGPEDIRNVIEQELEAGEHAAMRRKDELQKLKDPENLVVVRQLSDILCMLEWTKLAEANIQRLVNVLATMPRAFRENTSDHGIHEIALLKDKWDANFAHTIEQRRMLETEAGNLSENTNTIRQQIYDAATSIDIDMHRFALAEDLASVFSLVDESGNHPSGDDAKALLLDKVNHLLQAAKSGNMNIPMDVAVATAKHESAIIRRGMVHREGARKALKSMFERFQNAVDSLERLSATGDRRKRRRCEEADVVMEGISWGVCRAPPRLHFTRANSEIMITCTKWASLQTIVDKTLGRLEHTPLKTTGLRQQITQITQKDKHSVNDCWKLFALLIQVEAWVYFC